ncbi:peroxide stress protein YaaA [Jannaschia sp. Os4]|uniref:peroxide stress protein YaaA n=1 Tax=Jannaschia sp. Os4 TaxID=2807617 RepID=UPI00193ACB4E|nr:peroxide stress protein YaaA [Jannaschia sp. Os4]MBM2575808.1 peroxide stress protein YaaA [Jannaschia sp. Os4]
MLTVISPAKKMDMDAVEVDPTAPRMAAEADALRAVAADLTADGLARLMGISDKLAALNHGRFRDWDDAPSKPAAWAFAGDTYVGLDAKTLDADAVRRADARLRILSGLYGLLRPRDAIRAYRLEMGSRLANPRGRDLYAWWGDRISARLNEDAAEAGATHLLNCASQEYFGAVDREALRLPVVTPVFLEDRPDGPKTISFHAKTARGAMARFVMEHGIEGPDDLRGFDAGGYAWQADRSTPEAPVFLRAG